MIFTENIIKEMISSSRLLSTRNMSSFISPKHLKYTSDIFNNIINSNIFDESFIKTLDSYNVYCSSPHKNFNENIFFIMFNLYLKENRHCCTISIFENNYVLDFYNTKICTKISYTYKSNNIDDILRINTILRIKRCLL